MFLILPRIVANCISFCCNWEIVVFTFVEPQTINNFASLDQDTINDFNLYLLAQVKTSCPDKKKLAKWNGVKCGKVSFPFSGFFLPGLTSIYDLLPVKNNLCIVSPDLCTNITVKLHLIYLNLFKN